MLKRFDPDTGTPLGEGQIVSNPEDECHDILYHKDSIFRESQWRYDNPEAAGVLNSIVSGLSFGLLHYEGNKTLYFRDTYYRETWKENSCSPGEKTDQTIEIIDRSDWYDTYHALMVGSSVGAYDPGTHESGSVNWAWGQNILDFGGGQLTISTGYQYIHSDGSLSPSPESHTNTSSEPPVNEQGNTQAGDSLSSGNISNDSYGPEMSPVFMTGYDDINNDPEQSNYLSTLGGLPRDISYGTILSGRDLHNLFKSAYINGSKFGSVHIDLNKNYRVERMEFKQLSKRTIDDPNLIPVPVKYGYWALYLREKEN